MIVFVSGIIKLTKEPGGAIRTRSLCSIALKFLRKSPISPTYSTLYIVHYKCRQENRQRKKHANICAGERVQIACQAKYAADNKMYFSRLRVAITLQPGKTGLAIAKEVKKNMDEGDEEMNVREISRMITYLKRIGMTSDQILELIQYIAGDERSEPTSEA